MDASAWRPPVPPAAPLRTQARPVNLDAMGNILVSYLTSCPGELAAYCFQSICTGTSVALYDLPYPLYPIPLPCRQLVPVWKVGGGRGVTSAVEVVTTLPTPPPPPLTNQRPAFFFARPQPQSLMLPWQTLRHPLPVVSQRWRRRWGVIPWVRVRRGIFHVFLQPGAHLRATAGVAHTLLSHGGVRGCSFLLCCCPSLLGPLLKADSRRWPCCGSQCLPA